MSVLPELSHSFLDVQESFLSRLLKQVAAKVTKIRLMFPGNKAEEAREGLLPHVTTWLAAWFEKGTTCGTSVCCLLLACRAVKALSKTQMKNIEPFGRKLGQGLQCPPGNSNRSLYCDNCAT